MSDQPGKYERARNESDREWDYDFERWRYNWSYLDWSIFDEPLWDAQYALPGLRMEECLICGGSGMNYARTRDESVVGSDGIPFVYGRYTVTHGFSFVRVCECCGGSGCLLRKTS